ncbi:hypothetical protein ABZ128_14215 [Streptomyces sp. NPDC006326]|uniref:effector-associated constant component EACC1 n=1 Tax=Streptomyces sp. NPDC006326 TaxID=3156752 RepID=UPI0033AB3CEE
MPEYALRVDPVRPGDGPEAELRSLLRWLKEDEALGRDVRAVIGSDGPPPPSAPDPAPPATPMGSPGFDVLQLAVGSGLSAASLVFSVLQWQASRRRAPALTVTRAGYEVRLTGDAAEDPEVLRRIVAALEPQQPRDGDDDGAS